MSATNGEKNGKPREAPRVPAAASATGGAGERAPGGGNGVAGLGGPEAAGLRGWAWKGEGDSEETVGPGELVEELVEAARHVGDDAYRHLHLDAAATVEWLAGEVERLTRDLAQIRAAGSDLESDKDKYRDARCLSCGSSWRNHDYRIGEGYPLCNARHPAHSGRIVGWCGPGDGLVDGPAGCNRVIREGQDVVRAAYDVYHAKCAPKGVRLFAAEKAVPRG